MVCSGLLIKRTRQKKRIPEKALIKGLCRKIKLERIENDEIDAGKLLFEALCQRMGLYSGRYEELLDLDEYERYMARNAIYAKIEEIKEINKKAEIGISFDVQQVKEKYNVAKMLIDEYTDKNSDNVSRQLMGLVTCELFHRVGRPYEECMETLKKAMECTYNNFTFCKFDKLLYSRVEMYIISQYVRYMELSGKREEAAKKYEMIIERLENFYYDQMERSILYVPVGYWLMKIYESDGDYEKAVKIGEKTLENVKKVKSLSFFAEVYETLARSRKKLLEKELYQLKNSNKSIDKGKIIKATEKLNKYNEEYKNTCKYIDVIKKMHEKHGVDTVEHYFPRYKEDRVYLVNDVITHRRKHLGISRDDIAENICELGSLSRYENNKVSIQRNIRQKLLQRVRMSGDTYIASIDTYDIEVFDIVNRIGTANEKGHVEKVEELYEELLMKLDMTSVNNRQFMGYRRIKSMCTRGGRFDLYEKQICELLKESLGDNFYKNMDDIYLLNNEWMLTILYIQVLKSRGEYQYCKKYLASILNAYTKKPRNNIYMHSAIRHRMADIYGEMGEIEKAKEYLLEIVKIAAEEDDMTYIPSTTYTYAWNVLEKKEKMNLSEKKKCLEMIKWCYALSKLLGLTGNIKLIEGLTERHNIEI